MRRVLRRADDAIRRAGRVVIRVLWQDSAAAVHLTSLVPVTAFSNAQHREILQLLVDAAAKGTVLNDVMAEAQLSPEASEELSRAMVEDFGGQDPLDLYEDCVRTLRREYLHRSYEEHRLKADELQRQGDDGFWQELTESQRIKNEMDEL